MEIAGSQYRSESLTDRQPQSSAELEGSLVELKSYIDDREKLCSMTKRHENDYTKRSVNCQEIDELESTPLIDNENSDVDESFEIHCHDAKGPVRNRKAQKKLFIASCLCLTFVIGEFAGGYFAHSLAIMTDAAHMLSDFLNFMVCLYAIWLAKWPANKKKTFGYYRAEVLGALVSVVLIWVLTAVLVFLAIHRLILKEYQINADIMLVTAGLGLGINVVLGCILHQSTSGFSMFGSHGHGSHAHEKHSSINVRAAFIHVLGDILQSIGVLIAAYVIKYKPEWSMVDPICTFLFSVLVLFTTVKILRDAVQVLMEGKPRNIDYDLVKETLLGFEGVKAVHSLRIWSLTLDKPALAVHIAVDENVDSQTVLNQATHRLRTEFHISDCTIQVEHYQPGVMSTCTMCQDLTK